MPGRAHPMDPSDRIGQVVPARRGRTGGRRGSHEAAQPSHDAPHEGGTGNGIAGLWHTGEG